MDEKKCPELRASFLSRLLFRWSSGLVEKAEKGELTEKGLWDINPREKCQNVCPVFDQYLDNRPQSRHESSSLPDPDEEFHHQNGHLRHRRKDEVVDATKETIVQSSDNDKIAVKENKSTKITKHPSLWHVLMKTFWKEFLITQTFRFGQYAAYWITTPHFISYLMENSSDPNSSVLVGIGLCMCIFFLMAGSNLCFEHATFTNQNLEMHIRSSLMASLFKKALNLDSKSRKEYSVGEMTNLVSSDCDGIAEHLTHVNYVMFTPVHYVFVFYQLFTILGPAAGCGLVCVVFLMPLNIYVSVKIRGIFEAISKSKDEKMKVLNEILTGIKVLKLCAWEKCFGDRLTKARDKELKTLNRLFTIRAFEIFTWNAAPFMLSVVMFTAFFYLNQDSVLSAKAAFAVMSVLNLLRFAMNQTPELIYDIIRVNVSVKRVEKFLYADNIESVIFQNSHKNHTAISVTDADFSWDRSRSKRTLRNIDLSIPKGRLVGVVGQVGSGKTSLVSALLAEIPKLQGEVDVKGSIGYVSQQAWIQNDTLQNNILFGKDLDRELYRRVIQACALQPDLDLLPAGDQTEIGERGINLSGGQKQRVSLARAVYNDADIYLLDDPLSAVDSHVGKHIFDQVIGDNGILQEKTRVLVTHNIRYLPEVDEIFVMEKGSLVEKGSFKELLNSDGIFTKVLKQYVDEDSDNLQCIEELEQEEQEGTMKRTLKRLESHESGDHIVYKRQQSAKSTDVLRQVSTTAEPEEDEELSTVQQNKLHLFYEYTKAFGVKTMCTAILMYAMYYFLWVGATIWLVTWTEDPVLKNISDNMLRNASVCRDDAWTLNIQYLTVYASVGVIMSLCTLLFAKSLASGSIKASKDLHFKLMMSVLKSPMEYFDTTPVGRITSRFSRDIGVLDLEMPFCIESWLDAALNIAVSLVAVVYSTPSVLAVLIPLMYYYFNLQRQHTKQCLITFSLENKTRSPIESHFTESVMGVEAIRAYRAQDRFIAKMEDKVDNYHRMMFYSLLNHRWLGINMLAVGNVMCAASSMIRTILKGAQSAGLLGLGATFSMEINACMGWFVILQAELETDLLSMQRITETINSSNEADWRVQSSKPSCKWPESGQIEFRNYSLRYRKGLDLVLRNLSFTVGGGEKIGVVGRTGAGKSSLVLSLFRLVEAAEGSIFIDGIDIGKIGLHDLKEKLAIIPQDPVLFTGPLRMNLDPMDQYSDLEIWRALEHCNLQEFVQSLSDKLQAECGEGGNNFSVGQRQLFCLARTLLRKSKILVLDEATAAVDMETDDLIQQTIRSEFKDCTVLTIAHRLNTVMDYDRILVLDLGRVVEFDSPDSLVEQKGLFYQMTVDAGIGTNSRLATS